MFAYLRVVAFELFAFFAAKTPVFDSLDEAKRNPGIC